MAKFNNGKNLSVVIQLQKKNEKKALKILEKEASLHFGNGRYAYILHDKDITEEGKEKGDHIHLIFISPVGKSSENWLDWFTSWLKIDRDAISIEMVKNEKSCLRYLVHLDNPSKHQYSIEEVHTNMIDSLKRCYESANAFVNNPTLEQLINAAEEGKEGIYRLVGLQGYERACRVLDQIQEEKTREIYLKHQIDNLLISLCDVTANKKYLTLGYIPLKDYQDILESASARAKDILAYIKSINQKVIA